VLVQRVTRARVTVDERTTGSIGRGLLVFLGIDRDDPPDLVDWYARRLAAMKLFPAEDEAGGLWRRSVGEVDGQVLVVSQFTLSARTRKGRRPSFDDAAPPEVAEPLYRRFIAQIEAEGVRTAAGVFGARMQVELVNDGPVTFLLDGPRRARAAGPSETP
jgi:D-tyrosyl-tRNA(Tyr) deacylase